MANVNAMIDIDAPVKDVWDVATDVARLSEWVSIHRDFPDSTPGDLEVGTTFKQTLSVAGTPFAVEWTATEVDGPQSLVWEGTGPAGSTARTRYALAPENGGTRFTYENEFKLPVGKVGEAAAGVVKGQAEREAQDSLAKLKQLVER
jgi:uncharacterized protein YndB with AHSA1/START domain